MAYQYRSYSDTSHGTNNAYRFAPASATAGPSPDLTLKQQIAIAVKGKRKLPHFPVVFLMPSLLHDIQFAHKRKADRESNIQIACIDVAASRTPRGSTLTIRPVVSMMDELGLPRTINRRDGTVRFSAEYATLDSIVMKGESRTARFEDLLASGFYELFPAIQAANSMRGNSRRLSKGMNLELHLIKQLYFDEDLEWPLSFAKISLAAKLASCFKSYDSGACQIPVHILAAFLSFQRRSFADEQMLKQWLAVSSKSASISRPSPQHWDIKQRSTTVIDLTEDGGDTSPPANKHPNVIDLTEDDYDTSPTPINRPSLIDLTEEDNYEHEEPTSTSVDLNENTEDKSFNAMYSILKGHIINDSVLHQNTTIPERESQAEFDQFDKIHQKSNAKHQMWKARTPPKARTYRDRTPRTAAHRLNRPPPPLIPRPPTPLVPQPARPLVAQPPQVLAGRPTDSYPARRAPRAMADRQPRTYSHPRAGVTGRSYDYPRNNGRHFIARRGHYEPRP